jgi:hypothetical protein
VATSAELQCLGFISETILPADVFVAGTQEEGKTTLAYEGTDVHLSGPGVAALKPGQTYRALRAEGRVRDRVTNAEIGIYYKELGTVRVEHVESGYATAFILMSCAGLTDGDLVLPAVSRDMVRFEGKMSDRLTTYPAQGLASSIILGKDDLRELAAGHFCFIGVGARDGVKPGDRFTVFRFEPPFNPRDLIINGQRRARSYEPLMTGQSPEVLNGLYDRKLPARALGDLVVVEVGNTTATTRVINSRYEIHPGDIVVRR